MEMTLVKGWGCESCEFTIQDPADNDDISPLYECGNCGTTFNRANSANDNHQCPNCNKFGAKVAEYCCPDCESVELEEIDILVCGGCDEVVRVDDVRDLIDELKEK